MYKFLLFVLIAKCFCAPELSKVKPACTSKSLCDRYKRYMREIKDENKNFKFLQKRREEQHKTNR